MNTFPDFTKMDCETPDAQHGFASVLRYITNDPIAPIRFENANAGTCGVLTLPYGYEVWFGGDASEEGWIGCSVECASGPPETQGMTDSVDAETWEGVRLKLSRVLSDICADLHSMTTTTNQES